MEAESILVTGANRGIGLEFVKQLVNLPKPPRYLFATYRSENTAQDLKAIRDASENSQVVLIKMDITNSEEIESAKQIIEDLVGDKGLNLLINNAGALKYEGFPDITEDNMLFHFNTNTIGPVMFLKEMLPLLEKSASQGATGMSFSKSAVLNISSLGGSIGSLTPDMRKEWLGAVGYRVSKTALNMAMRVVALTIKDQGILVVNMCPGWVKTDLGSDQASLLTSESVSAILDTLPQLNESHHGTFLDRNGETIPY